MSVFYYFDRFPTGPYDKSYPAPSFYNPVPWKPIHVPPPETSPIKAAGRKPPTQRKNQQSRCADIKLRNTVGAAHCQQRRWHKQVDVTQRDSAVMLLWLINTCSAPGPDLCWVMEKTCLTVKTGWCIYALACHVVTLNECKRFYLTNIRICFFLA